MDSGGSAFLRYSQTVCVRARVCMCVTHVFFLGVGLSGPAGSSPTATLVSFVSLKEDVDPSLPPLPTTSPRRRLLPVIFVAPRRCLTRVPVGGVPLTQGAPVRSRGLRSPGSPATAPLNPLLTHTVRSLPPGPQSRGVES